MAEQDPQAPDGAENESVSNTPQASGGDSSPGGAAPPSPADDAARAIDAAKDSVEQLKSASAGTPPLDKSEERAASALRAAQDAIAMAKAAEPDVASRDGAEAVKLPAFEGLGTNGAPAGDLDLLADVNLQVKVELGRTRMLVEDVLRLSDGSVVELDKLAGDPVDVYVNERHVARGEVLVVNDNFCVRISEIISQPADD